MATTPSTHRNTTAAAKDAPCRSAHPHGGICSSTRGPCVAARKEHARQNVGRLDLGYHVQHSHAHASHQGPSIEKDAVGTHAEIPQTTQGIIWIRGSSGMSVARSTMSSHSVRRHRAQCAASNQDRPTPIATVNGTAKSMAPPIASVTTSRTRCSSPGATSRTSSSWICSSTRERSPCSASP